MGYASYNEDIIVRLNEAIEKTPQSNPTLSLPGKIASATTGTVMDSNHARPQWNNAIKHQAMSLLSGGHTDKARHITDFLQGIDKLLPDHYSSPDEFHKIERDLVQLGVDFRNRVTAESTHLLLHACAALSRATSNNEIRQSPIPEPQNHPWPLLTLWQTIENRWKKLENERHDYIRNYRPRLAEVGWLDLTDEQRTLVARDYDGHWRINAPAGTGKTVVLIHRAVRLFTSSPEQQVLVLTPTDPLASEIETAIATLFGIRDPRLRVQSLSQTINEWHRLRGEPISVAHSDRLNAEWNNFVDAADSDPNHILRRDPSQRLLRYLREEIEGKQRGRFSTGIVQNVDHRRKTFFSTWRALFYIRDEISYVASGFSSGSQSSAYANSGTERAGRQIRLEAKQRRTVLDVMESWRAWLAAKRLTDTVLAAADIMVQPDTFTVAEHVLVDEFQELGTCEWSLVVRSVRSLSGKNALLAVGDVEQVARVRRLEPSKITGPTWKGGLSFSGRATKLAKQYRITEYISKAAEHLVLTYPKVRAGYEDSDADQPRLGAVKDGVRPIVFDVALPVMKSRVASWLKLIGQDRTIGLFTVSPHDSDVSACEDIVHMAEIRATRLKRVGSRHVERVCYGNVNAVGGCEFDVVFLINFSALPGSHIPKDEFWREAATAYQAMTRARELLVLVCTSESPFVNTLWKHELVEVVDDSASLEVRLRSITAS